MQRKRTVKQFHSSFSTWGIGKKIQNGQTEPEGVQVYSERFSLFIAKRHKFKKKLIL